MAARGRFKPDPLASGEGIAFDPLPKADPSAKVRKSLGYTGPMDTDEKATRRTAGAQQRKWSASPAGQSRQGNASDWFAQTQTAHSRGIETEGGGPAAPVPVGQVYHAMGWGTPHPAGQEFHQPPMPGMERTDAAPESVRFEHLPHHEMQRTVRALEAHGTSLEQMERDYGAQLDQSFIRAHAHGTNPFSQHFYGDASPPEPGEPGKPAHVLHQGAKDLGVPLGVHVAMNAFTSPNTRFSTGKWPDIAYPNDETARAVVQQVQAGTPAKEVTPGVSPRDPSKKNQGYATNARKAADALEQHLAGVPTREWKGRISTAKKDNPALGIKSGDPVDVPEAQQKSPFAEKTGPYHNAWLPGAQDYFVSDVHSGGGGMLPHLGYEKPALKDAQGNAVLDKTGRPKNDKSERERAIEKIPNYHAAADYVARRAHYARGITSTRQGQAAQWGEEQIQRPDIGETEAHRYEAPKLFNDRRQQSEQPTPPPSLF